MSHPADTRPLIYDDLVATILARSRASSQPPILAAIETGHTLSQPSPGLGQTENPLFDSLSAGWTSGKHTPASCGTATHA